MLKLAVVGVAVLLLSVCVASEEKEGLEQAAWEGEIEVVEMEAASVACNLHCKALRYDHGRCVHTGYTGSVTCARYERCTCYR